MTKMKVSASACVVRHFSCVPIQAEELKAPDDDSSDDDEENYDFEAKT